MKQLFRILLLPIIAFSIGNNITYSSQINIDNNNNYNIGKNLLVDCDDIDLTSINRTPFTVAFSVKNSGQKYSLPLMKMEFYTKNGKEKKVNYSIFDPYQNRYYILLLNRDTNQCFYLAKYGHREAIYNTILAAYLENDYIDNAQIMELQTTQVIDNEEDLNQLLTNNKLQKDYYELVLFRESCEKEQLNNITNNLDDIEGENYQEDNNNIQLNNNNIIEENDNQENNIGNNYIEDEQYNNNGKNNEHQKDEYDDRIEENNNYNNDINNINNFENNYNEEKYDIKDDNNINNNEIIDNNNKNEIPENNDKIEINNENNNKNEIIDDNDLKNEIAVIKLQIEELEVTQSSDIKAIYNLCQDSNKEKQDITIKTTVDDLLKYLFENDEAMQYIDYFNKGFITQEEIYNYINRVQTKLTVPQKAIAYIINYLILNKQSKELKQQLNDLTNK